MHATVQSRTARRSLVAGLAVALTMVACQARPSAPASTGAPSAPSSTSAPSTPAASTPAPAATPVATGGPLQHLSITTAPFATVSGAPLSMTAPDDGSGRLFVGNQDGQIWIVNRDGSVEAKPLADLSAKISSGGERGLLGLAAHPAYPTDPRVFVDYTNNEGDTVIASLDLKAGGTNELDPESFKLLLFIDQPYPNHNGGSLQFGSDGYLTIAMGDGGSGGDPDGNGQNPNALLGKILRIDVDGSTSDRAYGIPPGNPFAAGGGASEVWLSGMRNPWRTSFDRKTGDFWIGDVGQGQWEEVDVFRGGTVGGANFGWNVTEGSHCYNASSCDQAKFVAPVTEYGHDLGCAIVGGYVYRGAAYPFLDGVYLFSDNCSSRIWAIDAASNGPSAPVQVGQLPGNVASLGEDSTGELYVLKLGGTIEKLVATQR